MKHLYTLLLIILPIVLFGQEFKIKGQLKNAPYSFILLNRHSSDNSGFTDTIPLDSMGNWGLKGKTKELSYLSFYTGTDAFELVLLPGESITVEADNRFFDQSYFLWGDGTKRNTYLHKCFIKEYENHFTFFESIYNSDSLSTITEYKKRVVDFLKMRQSFIQEFPELEVATITEEKIKEKVEMLLADFRSRFPSIQQTQSLQGTIFPNFKGISPNGDSIELADFKGKITVVDFWSNWCTICFENFPELHQLEKEFGEKVNFVSIGTYCKPELWLPLAQKESFSHQFFVDNKENMELSIGLYYIPRYIILDENHKVLQCNAPIPNSGLLRQYLLNYLKD